MQDFSDKAIDKMYVFPCTIPVNELEVSPDILLDNGIKRNVEWLSFTIHIHKTLTMTLRYSHLAPSRKAKAVDILDSTLNEKDTKYTKTIQLRG